MYKAYTFDYKSHLSLSYNKPEHILALISKWRRNGPVVRATRSRSLDRCFNYLCRYVQSPNTAETDFALDPFVFDNISASNALESILSVVVCPL